MTTYVCYRCGYKSILKNIKAHCSRKNICEPNLEDIEVNFDNFIRRYHTEHSDEKHKFICKYCLKQFMSVQGLKKHMENTCKVKEILPEKENNENIDENIPEKDIPKLYQLNVEGTARKVYLINDLKDYDKVFFINCTKNTKNIISKKKIPETEYGYARIVSENVLEPCSENSKKFAKLYISEKWTKKNYPKLAEETVEYDVPIAPEKIVLNDDEKLLINGQEMKIELIGKRNHKELYMNVHDVEKELEMPSLFRDLINKTSSYQENIDYKYFTSKEEKFSDQKFIRKLFLTYIGFQKIVMFSKNILMQINQTIFFDWINFLVGKSNIPGPFEVIRSECDENTLNYVYIISSPLVNACKIGMWRASLKSLRNRYITPYGNDLTIYTKQVKDARICEKKMHEYFSPCRITNELFIKHYYEDYKTFLDDLDDDTGITDYFQRKIEFENNSISSCVYLLNLGTVKDLRNQLNIASTFSDNNYVLKYGKTENLERRLTEHSRNFKKMKIVPVVERYSVIDSDNITEAENDLKNYFTSIEAFLSCKDSENKDLVEIVCVSPKEMIAIELLYKNIATNYIGRIKEFCDKFKECEQQLKMEEMKNKSLEKEIENTKVIYEQKLIILKSECENKLLMKELEMLKKIV